jgi:hypothetical protein
MSRLPVRRKTKIRKHHSPVRKYWWVAPVLLGVAMIGWIATGPRWSRARIATPVGKPIEGYVASTSTMTREYAHFYGKPLHNEAIERAFEQANQSVRAQAYTGAVGLLEEVSKVAAVPVVFNNLGVLYAELNDTPGAIDAFREALTRDADYPAVRLNLDRLREVMALSVRPVSRELEPNNDATLANIIALDKAVEGQIDAPGNDVDFFRVATPPAPRDLISIEIVNQSAALIPGLKIFDGERRITDWGKTMRDPGSSLRQTIAPPPNATLYLEVSGYGASAGAYTLSVKPRKAFDAYEPNDDISNARRISVGTAVAAGIMDADDTDYYSFASPRTGTVSILIANRSTTLIPALSLFQPDMRPSGSRDEVRTPGVSLRHTMETKKDQIYYVEVWSQAKTAGDYSLIIE